MENRENARCAAHQFRRMHGGEQEEGTSTTLRLLRPGRGKRLPRRAVYLSLTVEDSHAGRVQGALKETRRPGEAAAAVRESRQSARTSKRKPLWNWRMGRYNFIVTLLRYT